MFPQSNVTPSSDTEKSPYGKSFLYDFDKGDFILQNGRLIEIEGLDALKIWIDKVLRTEQFRFSIYDEYGVKLEDLIGGIYDKFFLQSEMSREIKEALIKHPLITNITNLTVARESDKTLITFDISTDEDTFKQEVTF